MTFINPSPHIGLPPALAQPQALAPRSAHVRTQVKEAVRAKPKIARIARQTPEQQRDAHQFDFLV